LNTSEQRLASTEDARQRDQQQFRLALESALSTQVMFQTGDSSLDEESERRLAEIAGLIEPMDGVTVVLEGHADARGDADYNEELSAARADAVKESLIRAGLGSNRISTHAEGERYAKAGEKDLDALALDRRVVLSVVNLNSGNRVARH
jgi:outer membrane protein OmpA-like peptidoglycan-associated protein